MAKTAKPHRVEMAIDDLAPAEYNPREISDAALTGLGTSVREFGYVQDLVWNKRTGRLVAGHQRLKVLREQGFTRVEVTVVDLDGSHERALSVSLNNPQIGGEFTLDLGSVLDDIDIPDFDAEFGELRFDDLVDSVAPVPAPDLAPPDGPSPDQSTGLEVQYRILIDCETEAQQQKLLQKFNDGGIVCRAFIL